MLFELIHGSLGHSRVAWSLHVASKFDLFVCRCLVLFHSIRYISFLLQQCICFSDFVACVWRIGSSERVTSLRTALEAVFDQRRDEKLDAIRSLEDEHELEFQRLKALADMGDASVVLPRQEERDAMLQQAIVAAVDALDAQFTIRQVCRGRMCACHVAPAGARSVSAAWSLCTTFLVSPGFTVESTRRCRRASSHHTLDPALS